MSPWSELPALGYSDGLIRKKEPWAGSQEAWFLTMPLLSGSVISGKGFPSLGLRLLINTGVTKPLSSLQILQF